MTAGARDRWLLAGAVVVWVGTGIVQLCVGADVGHDEAAFLIEAQHRLAGLDPMWLHRSIGTTLIATPGIALDSIAVSRFAALLVGTLVPLGTYALARATFPDRHIAGWAAAIVATSHRMLAMNADILSDLPAAGLILVGLAILVRELSRDAGPTWRSCAAAPLFVAAFYVRYGTLPMLAIVALASAVVFRRSIAKRPAPALAFAGIVLALLAPHFVMSIDLTGSLLGVIRHSSTSTLLTYPGQGLVAYVTANPVTFYGVLVAPAMLVALASPFVLRRPAVFVVFLCAVGAFVALGLVSHAQPRYVFLPVCLLVIAGAGAIDHLVRDRRLPAYARTVATAVIVAGWLGGSAHAVYRASAPDRMAVKLRRIGIAIAAHARGRKCLVVATRTPQLAIHSGCIGEIWPGAYDPPPQITYLVALPGKQVLAPDPPARPLEASEHVFIIDERPSSP